MKPVLSLTALGVTTLALRHYFSIRNALLQVPPEYRTRTLPLFAGDMNARSMRRTRIIYRLRAKPGPGVTVREQHVLADPPVRVLITTPTASDAHPRPGVLYLHGGGMVAGSPQTEAPLSADIARDVDAVVVAPDYRLAPEHPFPAALNDCMAVLNWMRENGAELGIDPDRIAVTGPSAGGGLSAAVAQRAHDEGISLRAQVLIYPMIDDRTALRDDHGRRGRFLWTPKSNRFGWTAYLGRAPRMSDAPEYSAPARRDDVSGLAPAWIGVGELDILHDEAVAYAEKLTASGVPCELITVPGMYHGADGLAPKAPAMQAFRRGSLDYLRAHL